MHPDELPLTVALAAADYASFKEYANPVDRWAILPLLRIIPPLEAKSVLQEGRLPTPRRVAWDLLRVVSARRSELVERRRVSRAAHR